MDSLFLTASAMTEAGLNTVNLSQLNTFQQFILFFLIMIGSSIFVSGFIVFARVRAFETKFKEVEDFRATVESRREEAKLARSSPLVKMNALVRRNTGQTSDVVLDEKLERKASASGSLAKVLDAVEEEDDPHTGDTNGVRPLRLNTNPEVINRTTSKSSQHLRWTSVEPPVALLDNAATLSPQPFDDPRIKHIGFANVVTDMPKEYNEALQTTRRRRGFISMNGVGARTPSFYSSGSNSLPRLARTQTSVAEQSQLSRLREITSGSIFKNAQFVNMTLEDRAKLGGAEWEAIIILQFLVPIYFFLWQFIGCIGLGAYVALNRPEVALKNGLNPWWMGAFNCVSAFNNSGMSLLDANMTAFQTSIYMLLSMGLLILAGNTAYPIFLRWIIWAMWRVLPEGDEWRYHKDSLAFLLKYPRRCYTNLFPAKATWWLLVTLVVSEWS